MDDDERNAAQATWRGSERAMWRAFRSRMFVGSIINVSLLLLLLASPFLFGLQGTIVAAALFLGSLLYMLIYTFSFSAYIDGERRYHDREQNHLHRDDPERRPRS
jgi:hypothetical protein